MFRVRYWIEGIDVPFVVADELAHGVLYVGPGEVGRRSAGVEKGHDQHGAGLATRTRVVPRAFILKKGSWSIKGLPAALLQEQYYDLFKPVFVASGEDTKMPDPDKSQGQAVE